MTTTVYIFTTPDAPSKPNWVKKAEKPKKQHPVENGPLVQFQYPSSKNGAYSFRTVKLISANHKYLLGLESSDKNRFKKFLRNRIPEGIELVVFNRKVLDEKK